MATTSLCHPHVHKASGLMEIFSDVSALQTSRSIPSAASSRMLVEQCRPLLSHQSASRGSSFLRIVSSPPNTAHAGQLTKRRAVCARGMANGPQPSQEEGSEEEAGPRTASADHASELAPPTVGPARAPGSFLTMEEAGIVEMSSLDMHERFLTRITISSLNLLRVIAEQENCSIEDLNAGRICDWYVRDKAKREDDIDSAVLKWDSGPEW